MFVHIFNTQRVLDCVLCRIGRSYRIHTDEMHSSCAFAESFVTVICTYAHAALSTHTPYVIVIIRIHIEAKSKSKVITLLGDVHYLYSYVHLTLQAALNSTSQTY